MREGEKWIWIVTGPNGSGKSTSRSLLPADIQALPFINPDAVANELAKLPEYAESPDEWLNPETEKKLQRYAAVHQQTRQTVADHLANGTSFGIEMGIPASVRGYNFKQLQADGWKIGVLALGLESAGLSQARVNERAANDPDGHVTPAAETTWKSCKRYTPALLKLADKFMLYDNSGAEPVLIASKDMKYAPTNIHHHSPNDYASTLVRESAAQVAVHTR